MTRFFLLIALFMASTGAGLNASVDTNDASEPQVCELDYQLVETRAHNPRLFTQGLEFHQGQLFESSGLYRKSFVVSHSQDGEAFSQKKRIHKKYFAEGLSFYNDKLHLLTWKKGQLLILDPKTLKELDRKKYSGQGWGLAYVEQTISDNSSVFIRSDGSSTLKVHNPDSFKLLDTIAIKNCSKCRFNELEFAQGLLWANDWQSSNLYAIDLNQQAVIGKLDASELVKKAHTAIGGSDYTNKRENVLNGIAFEAKDQRFWLTGKRWPMLFGVDINLSKCLNQSQ